MNAPSGRLGRYQLFESLEGGPTGEVFRAQVHGAPTGSQSFAVKRYHPALVADPRAATALAAAARMYAALEHPRIAKLHEFGEDGASTFVATEYVPGLDLGQLLGENQLSLGATAQLLVQVGRALGYAHSRGVYHLGLAPTNIICLERGGIKVTDFGMLQPRLSARPAEDSSLAQRICYLAPEQLEGRSTGPATDVYQLGVIAYELMTQRKPYAASSPGELAQQMLRTLPPDSGLPVPYEKLLKRAMARAAFERFSDAGAMADALEAALRSSPQTGSIADIGDVVRARLHGASSGMQGIEQVVEMTATPPPIPQGQGAMTRTILGQTPLVSPNVLPRPARPPSAAETIPDLTERARELDGGLELGPAGTDTAMAARALLGGEAPQYGYEDPHGFADDAPTVVQENSNLAAPRRLESVLGELHPSAPAPPPAPVVAPPPVAPPPAPIVAPPPPASPPSVAPSIPIEKTGQPRRLPLPASSQEPRAQVLSTNTKSSELGARSRSRIPLFILICAVVGVGGYFGYQELQDGTTSPQEKVAVAEPETPVPSPSLPSAVVEVPPSKPVPVPTPTTPSLLSFDAAARLVMDAGQENAGQENTLTDATIIAAATADAAQQATPDSPTPDLATPAQAPSDALRVESVPPGAKVYLDGSMVGITPLDLDASPDRHRLALLLAGHDLHTGDVDGTGLIQIDLKEVTPPGGPAGIKVRCRKKNRYYVYVNGNPVGQLCPSERIGVSKGKHVVEIYDPVTDSRRSFDVRVKDTRLSVRVKVD